MQLIRLLQWRKAGYSYSLFLVWTVKAKIHAILNSGICSAFAVFSIGTRAFILHFLRINFYDKSSRRPFKGYLAVARFFQSGAIMDLREVILGIFLVTGTYVGSAVFTIILFNLFFPLKTNVRSFDEIYLKASRKNESSSTKSTVPVLPANGRGWVNINS